MIRFYRPVILEVSGKRGNQIEKNINISLKTKNLKVEDKILTIDYDLEITYGKDTKLVLGGTILGQGSEEELKRFEEFWNNKKQLKEELFIALYNYLILNLFNKIVILADLIGLPAPVNLPIIRKENLNTQNQNEKNEKEEEINPEDIE